MPFSATFSPESSVILIDTIEVFGVVSVSAPYLGKARGRVRVRGRVRGRVRVRVRVRVRGRGRGRGRGRSRGRGRGRGRGRVRVSGQWSVVRVRAQHRRTC